MSAVQSSPVFNPQAFREHFTRALLVQNKAKRTAKAYCDAVDGFFKFAHIHPLCATVNHIRAYLFHLLYEKKYAPRTFNQILYGLRAFFQTYLPDVPIMDEFKRHRTDRRLITVLTDDNIDALIEAATPNLKHRAMIELLYSSGIRVGECAKLKLADIDSKEMLIHVEGKGEKDRYTIFAQTLLPLLRNYVRQYKPKEWLFEGRYQHQITTTLIEYAVRECGRKAGIVTKVTPHVLRHTFATNLLENGYDIRTIQVLLGHKHIRTTARYLHVRRDLIKAVKSPLDIRAQRKAATEAKDAK